MLNKLTALALTFAMLLPMAAIADPPELPPQPRIMGIEEGQVAPFAGVLLNSIAAAKVFTEKDFSQTQCDLRVKYEVEREVARVNMLLETTRVSMEAMDQRYTSLIQIKDNEIERLSEISSNTNDWSSLWYAGGVLTGVGLTIAIMYAIEARN
jgi:hypothetical protein